MKQSNAWKGILDICSTSDKTLLQSDTYRTQSVIKTFRRVWQLRSKIGITRLTDLTDLDYIGIPVASAFRPCVDDAQISATQGKGIRRIDALTSALLEAVERFSASVYKKTLKATTTELKANKCFYKSPDSLGAAPLSSNKTIEWINATSLSSGCSVFVPAAEVLFPYYPSVGTFRPMRPSTTGLAAGNTIAEAVLAALFEVIERDTVSKYLYGGLSQLLNLDSIKTGPELKLLNKFTKAGIDLFVVDLSHTSPLPVFFASLLNTQGPGPKVSVAGQGAHLSPQIALRRALLEAAQSRIVALHGSREDLIRHASDWEGDLDNLREQREKVRQAAQIGGMSTLTFDFPKPTSILDALQRIEQLLKAAGYNDAIYTNLTNPEILIPTVHVIVPGMVDTIVDPERRHFVPKP
ncbi:YcaO-like family protein [Nostoc sphaeroides]|uniref:YcaO, ribosomal protein S12 methylthiotransferase accessory factor n=1 Tax=Nostoc sphaeroides CCNUC1 TaxID=2653204 RepID=A0A5P8WJ29_9NOSO|nr:YcaO-like family protein [Nostoc sphaeroides]QFS52828.1 ycaO, ribosomal protein S12 methylthiotransferase accessory factor [Nostoc sphaeroides CCNUC1]